MQVQVPVPVRGVTQACWPLFPQAVSHAGQSTSAIASRVYNRTVRRICITDRGCALAGLRRMSGAASQTRGWPA